MTSHAEQLIEHGVRTDLAALAASNDYAIDLSPRTSFSVGSTTVSKSGNTVTAISEHTSPSDDLVRVFQEFVDDQSMFRQWLIVEPAIDVTVDRVLPALVDVSSHSRVHTVSGVQQQGGWHADSGPYRSFRLEHADLSVPFRSESGLRSTWSETPWAAITGEDIEAGGTLIAFEYGARWELSINAGIASFAPVGIVPAIVGGDSWTSPSVWIGCFDGDLDSAAAVTHTFMRDTVNPATPDDFPWVQYNTWFSWYCELDEQTLLAEADIAASLGIEVFYVDAGWWIGNPQRRDRFSSGLGNWTENLDKFPHGLKWFSDQIRAKGLHFGIWVEPERVDMRTVHTGTWKSEWIASDKGRYIRCEWPSDTDTAWLCYGHPDTQQWATNWIGDLVETLGVRWLKWDSNYWDVCTDPDHHHGTGDGEAAQIQGVYNVMQSLRTSFPDLIIENCAGGATRMDYAIARQTHCAWLNDASEPHYRSRFHNAGASYIYPPEMMNAWVTESEHENVNAQQLPADVWRAIIRSRMVGAIGFSNRLFTWSKETIEIARDEIAFYKSRIRPLLKTSKIYHLLPQPEIASAHLLTPDAWEAYQISSAHDDQSVLLAFRNVSPIADLTLRPKGIDPEATYTVSIDSRGEVTRFGADVIERGIPISNDLLASTIVTLRRETESA